MVVVVVVIDLVGYRTGGEGLIGGGWNVYVPLQMTLGMVVWRCVGCAVRVDDDGEWVHQCGRMSHVLHPILGSGSSCDGSEPGILPCRRVWFTILMRLLDLCSWMTTSYPYNTTTDKPAELGRDYRHHFDELWHYDSAPPSLSTFVCAAREWERWVG